MNFLLRLVGFCGMLVVSVKGCEVRYEQHL